MAKHNKKVRGKTVVSSPIRGLEINRISDNEWEIPPRESMLVPVRIFASKSIVVAIEARVMQQAANVASLPGIVSASYVMPDAHAGYGFPIGGVAAFDPGKGGVVSAGGVGFDIACGVRTLLTGCDREQVLRVQHLLADTLQALIPAGVGSKGELRLDAGQMEDMLSGGARWAVGQGFGLKEDLLMTEEGGTMYGALPEMVSSGAKERQMAEMGSLGSGNHYLEVQEISRICDSHAADAYGLRQGDVVVSIHCGSRGLGHQIGTDYLARMLEQTGKHGLKLRDPELACAPIRSDLGQAYLGAMRAGINCALANRQILTHRVREAFARVLPQADLRLLYDVSHNTCKEEKHSLEGKPVKLFIHRKGATRAFGPGHQDLPEEYRSVGQPVLVGSSMGTSSSILAGCGTGEKGGFSSANHGAGRAMSRSQAQKIHCGRDVLSGLEHQGILLRAGNLRAVAEEAPGAYKDVNLVVQTVVAKGLAKEVAELRPLICIKG